MSLVSGRLGRALAGAAAIVAVAAGLALVPSANAGVEPDGPHYQESAVGECRTYTMKQAYAMSNSSPVVECSTTHTALTIAVVQLPDNLTWGSSQDALNDFTSDHCTTPWWKAVGGTLVQRAQAAFTEAVFYPNQTQKDHGARWIRCDVNLYGHHSFIPLPRSATPFIRDGKVPYAVTKCIFGQDNYFTACVKAHHHRATGAFALADGPYPGDLAIKRAATRRCPAMTFSRSYIYYHPTRETWKNGARIIICFSKTTH